MDFLNYLKVCRGKLGTDADEELAAMQKTCASIMGFVHNHPCLLYTSSLTPGIRSGFSRCGASATG